MFYCIQRNLSKKIDCKVIVEQITQDTEVLHYYSNICHQTDVENENAINLLEQLVMLYIRVRSFSYAKDKV